MDHSILSENRRKRQNMPLWMLICFSMFMFWQMGFIYFVGPSLTVDGKTPLPIDMDNATTLIAVSYILSILWMIFLPRAVIPTQRIATGAALVSAVALFLPLSADALRFFVYAQVFCCCFMIGFETFIMVNYFSEKSSITHLTLAYGTTLVLIALLQNDLLPISFSLFRFVTVGAILLLLLFLLRMPAGKDVQPRYVKKSDGLTAPKKLFFGAFVLCFICSLMAVSGPAIAGEVKHGVSILYLVDATASFVIYLLYKKRAIHPFRLVPVMIGLGGIGFLLMFAATQLPALTYAACALIGFGMVSCQMLPLYGAVMMNSYPSKYISPSIIGLALAAVIVQGSMVEIFRTAPTMLYLVYCVIMAVLVFLYMQIEPFLLFSLRSRAAGGETGENKRELSGRDTSAAPEADPLDILSEKEREVAELICLGYTNADIAKVLYISEHTVKTHTKNIYPKLGVHSRLELAAMVSRERMKTKDR